ncbi:MAG: UvrD-helicase domain-containing protein, partial [Anaerolineae bacterium]
MLEELHPIVAQLTPNQEQLPAVLSRGCDVVVTAGAGTGKTRTLVARYLSLLADGMPLRRIIAVTFTRKAAREMRNRVRAEVQRYLNQADLSPEQRDRWQAVYAGLDAARIGTIHSLCTEILRAHPAEAGVDPRFAVLEEGEAAQLRREVVTAALAWAADEPDAVGLFALLRGPDNLRSVVGSLLKQRLDVSAAIETASVDPLAHWQEALEERQAQRLSALLSKRAWSDAVAILRRSTPIDPQDAMAEQRRWALRAIDEATPVRGGAAASHRDAVHTNSIRLIDDRLASLSRLGEISLVGGSYKAWAGGKAEKTAVKDALRTLRRLWRGHADLLSLQINPLDERLAEAMPSLRALLLFSVQQYQGEKRDERALDFDDLESRAVELLENHPEVRARWQHEAEAILVDEFQDTNERQRRLVHLLAGDGSTQSASSTRSACPTQSDGSAQSRGNLFIVGDAKQSIYGFRGADVTVFRREREHITGRAGHPGSGQGFALATSYRAHQGLVEALNDLLRPVLGEKDDPHRPWAEPFSPIEPHRATPAPGIEPPYVECHLSVGSKGDGALDRAAQALVARLAQTVEGVSRRPAEQPSNRSLPEGDSATMPPERRPLTYGDVAILCRASTSFSAYEDALDEAGLPYVTVAGRGFYDRPEVRDLLNALRALSDPTDDAALVGLLRSPAIALSDAAVYQLVRAREASSPPGDHVPPLWTVLPHVKADLGPVAEMRVSRAVTLIGRLHTLAGRTGVGDLLKAFLDETHYRAALIRAGQPRAVRNVDKLLDDAQASGLVGVGAFLELVGGLQDSGAREGEARALAGGAVQIMSVHQAKGLEFPIVVLGDATWGSGGSRQDVLVDPE